MLFCIFSRPRGLSALSTIVLAVRGSIMNTGQFRSPTRGELELGNKYNIRNFLVQSGTHLSVDDVDIPILDLSYTLFSLVNEKLDLLANSHYSLTSFTLPSLRRGDPVRRTIPIPTSNRFVRRDDSESYHSNRCREGSGRQLIS